MPGKSYQYESAYNAVTEVTSRELDNIVLLYGASRDEQLNALAFQVNRTVRRIERVTNGPTLAADGSAGDTLGFGYFGENGHSEDVSDPGDEVFQIETDRSETLVEYGFAIDPDDVYVGVRTADDAPVIGLRPGSTKARGFGAEDLEQYGGVLSNLTRTAISDSDDELPTTALSPTDRQGLFRIDSKQDGLNRFRFAFSNQANASQTVSATAIGQTYEVNVLQNEEDVLSLIDPAGPPARIVTWGGWDNTTPNLPSEWFNARVNLDVNEIPLSQ